MDADAAMPMPGSGGSSVEREPGAAVCAPAPNFELLCGRGRANAHTSEFGVVALGAAPQRSARDGQGNDLVMTKPPTVTGGPPMTAAEGRAAAQAHPGEAAGEASTSGSSALGGYSASDLERMADVRRPAKVVKPPPTSGDADMPGILPHHQTCGCILEIPGPDPEPAAALFLTHHPFLSRYGKGLTHQLTYPLDKPTKACPKLCLESCWSKNVRHPNDHRGPSAKPLPRRRHEPNCEHFIIQQYRKAKSLKTY
jgi:hypothetical protein